jgi:hypothetical protein
MGHCSTTTAVFLIGVILCGAVSAGAQRAQEPEQTPLPDDELVAESSNEGSDMVRTSDGTVIRGTILERVTDSHVLIESAGGDRFEFDWAEVTYAGPAAADTTSSAESTTTSETPPDSAEPVAFTAARADEPLRIEAYQNVAVTTDGETRTRRQWSEPCATPCSIPMADPRATTLRASRADGSSGTTAFTIEEYVSGDVAVAYNSRRGARIALGASGGALMVTGLALVIKGLGEPDSVLIDGDGDLSNNHLSRLTRWGFLPLVVGIGSLTSSFFISDNVDVRYEGDTLVPAAQ